MGGLQTLHLHGFNTYTSWFFLWLLKMGSITSHFSYVFFIPNFQEFYLYSTMQLEEPKYILPKRKNMFFLPNFHLHQHWFVKKNCNFQFGNCIVLYPNSRHLSANNNNFISVLMIVVTTSHQRYRPCTVRLIFAPFCDWHFYKVWRSTLVHGEPGTDRIVVFDIYNFYV